VLNRLCLVRQGQLPLPSSFSRRCKGTEDQRSGRLQNRRHRNNDIDEGKVDAAVDEIAKSHGLSSRLAAGASET